MNNQRSTGKLSGFRYGSTSSMAAKKCGAKTVRSNPKSHMKHKLDVELFEHHLLGFGPCG